MTGSYNYNADIDVQWPFGYGMSYTSFEYSDISVDKQSFAADDDITVSVTVRNSGSVPGMEPVILYSSDWVASITPDVRRVRRFEKVNLKSGESAVVKFTLKASDLAFVGNDGLWTIESGDFEFTAGNQKVRAHCTENKKWSTPNI